MHSHAALAAYDAADALLEASLAASIWRCTHRAADTDNVHRALQTAAHDPLRYARLLAAAAHMDCAGENTCPHVECSGSPATHVDAFEKQKEESFKSPATHVDAFSKRQGKSFESPDTHVDVGDTRYFALDRRPSRPVAHERGVLAVLLAARFAVHLAKGVFAGAGIYCANAYLHGRHVSR